MKNRWLAVIAAAACCVSGAGCQSVTGCGDGCGASLAFQKYDCACDGVCGECCSGGGQCGCQSGCGGCDSACGGGLMGALCGCTGCGELYWNEWHNDPPTVCEPCDRCGNYKGPGGSGYYRAPYRRGDFMVAKPPAAARPLEVAERQETRE